MEREDTAQDEERGNPILRSEFDKALKEMKTGKAEAVYEIASELLKNAEVVSKNLYELICGMYGEGEMPIDFQKSRLIP